MISFVVPYQHNNERFNLLQITLLNIPKDPNIEICLVELGTDYLKGLLTRLESGYKGLMSRSNFQYTQIPYEGVFHRALAMNVGAKKAKGDIICLLEGDIIFKSFILDDIRKISNPIHCCDSIYFMNKIETQNFINTNNLPTGKRMDAVKLGSPNGLAGGLVAIKKDLFMDIKGIPEMFKGTWGGDDNALWLKLLQFGFPYVGIYGQIFHLYHSHKTKCFPNLHSEVLEKIKTWTREDWENYNKEIGDNWGKI